MAGKIFYRARRKAVDGEKKPRYKVVGVEDVQLKIYAEHLRKSELEHIAQEMGADLVELRRGSKHQATP